MLFFFFVNTLNRYFRRAAKIDAKINKHVEIFENFSSSDFLHDLNSLSSSSTKRSFKRFLNDVTANASNKLTKAFKHAENRSSDKKNRSHASKKSRVEPNVTFYFSTSSLLFHIISRRRRKESFLLFSSFTFISFSFFFSFA